jgi:hypothetical protein
VVIDDKDTLKKVIFEKPEKGTSLLSTIISDRSDKVKL